MKNQAAKRVDLVSLYMVKERSIMYQSRYLNSLEQVVTMVNEHLRMDKLDRESFVVIALDAKCCPTHISTISTGSLTASIVHPREVYKLTILSNAHSIVAVHNHPSGNPIPSSEDYQITKRLKEVEQLIGITLIDHIIIGEEGNFHSLKENEEL